MIRSLKINKIYIYIPLCILCIALYYCVLLCIIVYCSVLRMLEQLLEELHGRMLLRRTDRESEMKEQQLGMKPVRRKMTGFHGCIKAVLRCEIEQIN